MLPREAMEKDWNVLVLQREAMEKDKYFTKLVSTKRWVNGRVNVRTGGTENKSF